MIGLFAFAATLAMGAPAAGSNSKKAALKPAVAKTARPIDAGSADSNFDVQAEQQLLELANQARAQAGAPPLQMSAGLTAAARAHALEMVQQQQLSHQFTGEPGLPQRIAANSDVHLDREGENVALDVDAEQATEHLLQSPHHRENLLDPSFNVAGFAVVHDGARIYVVQDFGHSLPSLSTDQTANLVGAAVNGLRDQQSLGELQQTRNADLQSTACGMAQQDHVTTQATRQLAQRYHVVTYTTTRPDLLPHGTENLISDRHLSSFSVGTCYARSATYPGGVNWVVLVLY
jgi:uncharacterized protein YkwD